MSYMSNLDAQTQETIDGICEAVATSFPEGEFRADGWQNEVAHLVRGLVNTVLKGGSDDPDR